MTKLSTVLDQVDNGTMLLPEFQRGYVWNRDQVRGLMRSVYRDYPVGALLVWETEAVPANTRGSGALAVGGGPKHLLLDGQQRVTTLYGVIRGKAPGFFEGEAAAFTGLYFNVETESFEFYGPAKMKDDPRWISVTDLFVRGPQPLVKRLMTDQANVDAAADYVSRLTKLHSITNRDFHIETISGADKTVDVVVDIFNRVNSGGTKLSKGDLALARICAEWNQARPWMRSHLERWTGEGYTFSLDWILRNINAVATGRAPFSALEDVSAAEFERALHEAAGHVDHLLGLCSERLALDHDRVLLGRYAFPVLARVLHGTGGRFRNGPEADRALYWFIHAALRGRFAGSTETVLTKDLETADRGGVDGLISSLARWRGGRLDIEAADFEGTGRGSRFYPLLYLLVRVRGRHDLVTGEPLDGADGPLTVLEIFSKAALYKAGYSRAEVNSIANFAFVTSRTAPRVNKRLPDDYLREARPEDLAAQWVPTDPELWSVTRYRDFLAARQEMLARAANDFLADLLAGTMPWDRAGRVTVEPEPEGGPRAAQLRALVEELVGLGYAEPALSCEIPDPETGRVLSVAEAFWADGLQPGQGSPVVLELDPEEADLARLTELGCEVFTSVEALRSHVARRNEVASGDRADDGPSVHVIDTIIEPEEDESDPTAVAQEFDTAVLTSIDTCVRELRYNPRYFRVMVSQYGTVGATRRLLQSPAVGDGFVKLWELDRLDLTLEAIALDPRFADLFTADELDAARRRLTDFGYAATG